MSTSGSAIVCRERVWDSRRRRLGAATGIANALFLLERGAHQWVLRRPPAVKNDPSASDTLREWRILVALEDTAVPHPKPLLLCDDTDVLGRAVHDHGAGRRLHPRLRAA